MRVACIFDESRQEYKYFTQRNATKLIRLLQSADEVVSFNGKCFDLLVLRKHYGLKGRVPRKGQHIDMHEIMSAKAGFRVSLNVAVNCNFGEKKHTDGRKMNELSDDKIKAACRSDVSHTHRLFQNLISGTLLYPARMQTKMDEEFGGDGNMPRECSSCQAVNSLESIEWDTDDMSEGQLFEYIAGMYGSAQCRKCGDIIDFGF